MALFRIWRISLVLSFNREYYCTYGVIPAAPFFGNSTTGNALKVEVSATGKSGDEIQPFLR